MARDPAEHKPQDWSYPLSLMAHFYPGINVQEIDEQQMNGYLQHVHALTKMQAGGVAALLAGARGGVK